MAHTMKRNLKIGDIVLIQDSNQIRGQWKLGKVSEVFPGEDGIVRKVHVTYKNPKQGEPANRGAPRACVGGAPLLSKSTHPRKFGNHVTVH